MKQSKNQQVQEQSDGKFLKKEMKQSKLLFLFNIGSVICLVIIFAALGITTVKSRSADALNDDRFVLTECATHFIDASSYLTSEVRAYVSTGDKQNYNNYMNELKENKTRERAIEKMKEIGITAEEQAQVDQMMELTAGLVALEEQAIEDAFEGNFEKARECVLGSDYNNTILRIHEQKLEFLNSLAVRTSSEVNQSVAVVQAMEMGTVCIILFIIVLQLICFSISHKRIINPIIAIEQEMRNLAQGKFSESFSCQPNTSEMGMMIESILTMRQTLKLYISDICEKLTRMAAKDITVRTEIEYIGEYTPIKDAMNIIICSMNDILG